MIKKIISLSLVFLSLTIVSCRGQEASLLTLDEFAGISGGSYNVCKGSFNKFTGASINVNGSSSSIIRTAVEQTLTAVPINVQKVFFGMGGKIVVNTEKAQSVCPPLLNSEEFKAYVYGGTNSQINTCWSHKNGAPTIFMEEDIDKIRHSLLRTFSYIYSQIIYPAAKQVSKINTNLDQKNFTALKDAFLADLNTLNTSRASALASMEANKLEQYVFAEAFDSYYCNASTKKSFQTKFTRTWNVFNNMLK